MIPINIPVITIFLQETYRNISTTNLIEKEEEVKDYGYDPTEPIDTVFNKIDHFLDLCEFISDPISDC